MDIPFSRNPLNILTYGTTPLNLSNVESNIKALVLLSFNVLGDGIFSIIDVITKSIPIPSLALIHKISFLSHPSRSIVCEIALSKLAFGESILFIIGITSKLASAAK